MTMKDSAVQRLSDKLGESWPAIMSAMENSAAKLADVREIVRHAKPPVNTSVVAFGSLARGEWTTASDVDWTLLIDGPSVMQHLQVLNDVQERLDQGGFKPPGATGTFGNLSSSHELVHHIGGLEDTNQNITRRMLLVLESVSLSDTIAHERVIRAILERYIAGDPPSQRQPRFRLPLFLLNDVVRFWRTMAVDYATKRWQRSSAGWAIRNFKLRMSRKLLFAKGMLVCFLCDEEFAGKPQSADAVLVEKELQNVCFHLSRTPAIELLAEALLRLDDQNQAASVIMSSYDSFLSVLDDEGQREHLVKLPFGQEDESFNACRRTTNEFLRGLTALFFETNERLTQLTKRYGVF